LSPELSTSVAPPEEPPEDKLTDDKDAAMAAFFIACFFAFDLFSSG
jgi:hypothetical protein